jgi:hypothetical protein
MRLRQVGHARLGTAQCDLRRCDYFLMLTHACPSVLSRRELTAPCAPWLAAAATSLLKKSESERPATVGAMCVSSSSTSCINFKYESETRVPRRPPAVPPETRPASTPHGRAAGSARSRRTLRRRSPGTRNGRRDARGVGGNRTQRRRQMRRRRAGGSSRGGSGEAAGGQGRQDARPRNRLSREC